MEKVKITQASKRVENISHLVTVLEALNIKDVYELSNTISAAVQAVEPSLSIRFRYGLSSDF